MRKAVNRKYLILAVMFPLLLTGCRQDTENAPSVGFVNIQKALSMSGLTEKAHQHLDAVEKRLHEGEKLARGQYDIMSEARKREAEAADRTTLEVQWLTEQQRTNEVLNSAVMKAVHNWQSRNHIDMIFPDSTALYFADSLDITSQIADEIKDEIKKENIRFAALPDIRLQKQEENKGDKKAKTDGVPEQNK